MDRGESSMLLVYSDAFVNCSCVKVRRQNSTTAEELARLQRLFPNPSWLMSGRTSGHQNRISIFSGIDNCLKAKP